MIISDSWPGGIRSFARSLLPGHLGVCRAVRGEKKTVQNVDEMAQLARGCLGVFASGTHVDDGSAINIEAR